MHTSFSEHARTYMPARCLHGGNLLGNLQRVGCSTQMMKVQFRWKVNIGLLVGSVETRCDLSQGNH